MKFILYDESEVKTIAVVAGNNGFNPIPVVAQCNSTTTQRQKDIFDTSIQYLYSQ